MASAAPSTLNAVVIGATGAIGKRLVAALLLAKVSYVKLTRIFDVRRDMFTEGQSGKGDGDNEEGG